MKKILTASCLGLALFVGGCGGGGGSGGSGQTPPPVTPPPVTPPPVVTNTAPTANAGPDQNVLTETSVTLDGSASSDADSDPLTYKWTFKSRPTGSVAVLSSLTDAKPTFTADVAGAYVATLIVNDGKTDSAAVDVTITATVANAAPVANAGPDQNVHNGILVTLDGSASSDANGDTLTYQWTLTSRPAGSASTLTSATNVKPTFTPDIAGTYVVSLIVSDGSLNSIVDSVTITSSTANSAPVANAGANQNVHTGVSVTLDGRNSSDANGDTLSYKWTLTSRPAGSAAALSSTTQARPTFTADVAGTYVATLIVNDDTVDSTAATVTVTAVAPTLSLYSVSTGAFAEERLLKLPYTTASAMQKTQSCVGGGCPTGVTVDQFKLVATGGSFTIEDLSAVNLTNGSTVTASFGGLSDGMAILNGQTVNFTLQSGFTRGQNVNLRYSFTIKETGAKFSYTVELRTN